MSTPNQFYSIVKSIQRAESTNTGTGLLTVTLSTAVNPLKAVLNITSCYQNGNTTAAFPLRCWLKSDGTAIEYYGPGAGANSISWQVVEYY